MDKVLSGLSLLKFSKLTSVFFRPVVSQSSKSHVFPAYVKLHFHEVKNCNPTLKAPEILKKLSEMYKATSPAELAKLNLGSRITTFVPKTSKEKMESRKKLTFARKHGLPKPQPLTGYMVFIHEKLSGNKGLSLQDMTAKLSDASKAWQNLPESNKESCQIASRQSCLFQVHVLRLTPLHAYSDSVVFPLFPIFPIRICPNFITRRTRNAEQLVANRP
uniref:HMG box domain-containing protein n=1 Tax=Mesocestoides corti TaxID=53468 RepID=A0A5K3ENQ8_MESCO